MPITLTLARPRVEWLPRAVLAGFVATTTMAILFIVAYMAAQVLATVLPDGGQITLWLSALTHNSVLDIAATSLAVALSIHLVVGVLWAVLYAVALEPRLQGHAVVRGMTFSLLPWLLSLVVFLPLVGGGWFGLALGAGPLPALGNLILHLCYGLTLGATYGPLSDLPADDLSQDGVGDDPEVMRRYERTAAWGILVGAGVGTVVGLALLARQPGPLPGAVSPLFLVPVAMVLGAAFGGWWGSLYGLNSATAATDHTSREVTATTERREDEIWAESTPPNRSTVGVMEQTVEPALTHALPSKRPMIRAIGRAALVILLGLFAIGLVSSMIFGPILLLPVILLGYLALGAGQLLDREEKPRAAAPSPTAELMASAEPAPPHGHAREAASVWGKVTQVRGQCPNGRSPQLAQVFTVDDGQIWPALCVHAQRAVLAEVARMQGDLALVTGVARYADADHRIELELHRSAGEWQEAA